MDWEGSINLSWTLKGEDALEELNFGAMILVREEINKGGYYKCDSKLRMSPKTILILPVPMKSGDKKRKRKSCECPTHPHRVCNVVYVQGSP